MEFSRSSSSSTSLLCDRRAILSRVKTPPTVSPRCGTDDRHNTTARTPVHTTRAVSRVSSPCIRIVRVVRSRYIYTRTRDMYIICTRYVYNMRVICVRIHITSVTPTIKLQTFGFNTCRFFFFFLSRISTAGERVACACAEIQFRFHPFERCKSTVAKLTKGHIEGRQEELIAFFFFFFISYTPPTSVYGHVPNLT